MMTTSILVINGHPHPQASLAGKCILEAFKSLCPQACIRSLSETVNGANFDVAAEQAALLTADTIVWQFPFYWYSVPALMKNWIDSVLVHGFAFGTQGTALHGKKLLLSFTTGAAADKYVEGGAMGWPVEDFLPPLLQTARLCGMTSLAPVWSSGMSFIAGVCTEDDRLRIEQTAKQHAKRLFEVISNNEVYAP